MTVGFIEVPTQTELDLYDHQWPSWAYQQQALPA
jgi:hypothetical protein